MRHQNLRAFRDEGGVFHIVARGKRFITICGLTFMTDWTLVAFPRDDACVGCYENWKVGNTMEIPA